MAPTGSPASLSGGHAARAPAGARSQPNCLDVAITRTKKRAKARLQADINAVKKEIEATHV
jgi:hypothetical protein